MRSVLVLIFLLGSLVAKDNFVYNEDKIKCDERLKQLEEQMATVATTQEKLLKYAKLADTNQVGVEQNEKKIAKIMMMNRSSDKKVAQIADSLSGIKNILAESKAKLYSDDPEVIVEPVISSPDIDTESFVKKDEYARHAVEVDNLMDRVSILEKKSMTGSAAAESMKAGETPSMMDEARSAIYDYFEYYVITTVILFFMMFIIIFSLVAKTRHLQMVVSDILDRE